MKSIVLIGMPGAGKTSVGKLLAEDLNVNFVDIDALIEKHENCSISQIFERNGEEYFRKTEAKIIKDIFKENQIMSLGGGAFENSETRDLLLNNCIVIYLETSSDVIYSRIKDNTQRPLLNNNMSVEKIKTLLNIREKNYKLANYTIVTDNKDVKSVVGDILKCVNLK